MVSLMCALLFGALGAAEPAGAAAASERPPGASVIALANTSSAPDLATATSLAAAGAAQTVVFAESSEQLGDGAASIIREQQHDQVLIVGGTAAVAQSVETELRRLSPGVALVRFAGRDRVHTASLAARFAAGGRNAEAVVVANGWSLSDVGAAASGVAQNAADAVLLTGRHGLGESTVEALRSLGPDRVFIAGGEAAVSEAVEGAISAAVPGVVVERLGGATRLETAWLFANRALEGGASTVVLADGWATADVVIAAAVAAALDDAAVLYTQGDELGNVTELALFEHRPARIVVVSTAAPVGHARRSTLRGFAPGASIIAVRSPHEATHLTLGISPPPPAGEFTAVSVGPAVSCAVAADSGELTCWGDDEYRLSSTPDGVFADVSVNATHACAVRANGAVACWSEIPSSLDASQARAPEGSFTAVASGLFHTCGLRTDATVACWGAQGIGPLDLGQAEPAEGRHIAISAGAMHTCAVSTDASVVCWGSNERGQADAPSGKFAAVSAAAFHTCAIRSSGSLACWGASRPDVDFGQADAPGGLSFKAVAAGTRTSCGVYRSGVVVCWGDTASGQSSPPVGSYISVAVGLSHACAIRADRTLTCWGARHPLRLAEAESSQRTPADGEVDDVL